MRGWLFLMNEKEERFRWSVRFSPRSRGASGFRAGYAFHFATETEYRPLKTRNRPARPRRPVARTAEDEALRRLSPAAPPRSLWRPPSSAALPLRPGRCSSSLRRGKASRTWSGSLTGRLTVHRHLTVFFPRALRNNTHAHSNNIRAQRGKSAMTSSSL